MRSRAIAATTLVALWACVVAASAEWPGVRQVAASAHATDEPAPTFKKDIAPLLKTTCAPCHFKDGQVVGKYPFEDYETVRKLGLRLNTRLKGANADLVTRWVQAKSPE